MHYLIGSRALNFWNPSARINDNADWDIVTDFPMMFDHLRNFEHHKTSVLNNSEIGQFASDMIIHVGNTPVNVVTMEGLAAIKRSHLHRSLSFQKHITHYHKHGLVEAMRSAKESTIEFLVKRIELTKKEYPQGNPNLMQKNEEFFDDYVTKVYNHDWLHEQVAYYDKPLYTRLQDDPTIAWCKKEYWQKLSHQEKCECVLEEAMVIAIERFIVSPKIEKPLLTKLAILRSVDKICTTLCSGWFRDFAIDYYDDIYKMMLSSSVSKVDSVVNKLKEENDII
jgi:hypothetical protein